MNGAPDPAAIAAIVAARHGDPFAVLGPHEAAEGCAVRVFLPEATAVAAIAREGGATLAELARIDGAGFWCGVMPAHLPYRLRVTTGAIEEAIEDPYAFGPVLGDLDIHLLAEGRHHEFGRTLGAHLTAMQGVSGVRFAVWAPNARRVSVVGSFNRWDGRRHPMRLRHAAGVWELFIPRNRPRRALQIRAARPGRRSAAAEGRSGRGRRRAATRHRLDRDRRPRCTGTTRHGARRRAAQRRADQHL